VEGQKANHITFAKVRKQQACNFKKLGKVRMGLECRKNSEQVPQKKVRRNYCCGSGSES
jgi:hypothetical protein